MTSVRLKKNDRIYLVVNSVPGRYNVVPALFWRLCQNPEYCDAVYYPPGQYYERLGSGKFRQTYAAAVQLAINELEAYRRQINSDVADEKQRLRDAEESRRFPNPRE